MPFITAAAGVELHYEDFGSGDPVVLIHGWPLSGRSWEAQIAPLVEAGKRVITYDRRGFGQSSQPWDGYDYDTFAADLDALLTALELTNVTLVGFSMGGGEVARYLGAYGSARVARAVFAGAVPPYLYKTEDNPGGGLDDATIKSFQDGVIADRIAFVDGFAANFFTAGGTSKVSDAQVRYAQELAHVASAKGTLDCIGAFSYTDFRPDLAKIDVPVLVIHGDSDAIVPIEVSGARTAESIPGAKLVVIKDGPHGINASHPAEFNQALIEFLNS
ncbi:arylesterase [Actinoplanes cyaneus]|uniref:Arylesterase n=1 Tax=Actinoplanes cyaneus TaxID=52696 RepID=A0A919M7Y4_9ACTN|nr:alpha/beta hydrolase [Actinoplanes cyaneus]MCW2142245.1 Pimeloyl-ACP methyl ester carboxylesterase [Actinoplanes cyaneus]GID69262.1 arylesterase [Actinoplanes cyaneus]